MNARHTGRRSPARFAAALVGMVLASLFVAGGLSPAEAQSNSPGKTFAPIRGSGSTWSANALEQWMRNVYANYQWNISYNQSGSTVGRNEYANNTADFGVSEIPYNLANSNEPDNPPTRKFSYMPIVAGGTAFMYNLKIGGQRVTNLRLSGDVLAKIFTNVITVWNDPAIAADNPSLRLPATPIVPVVRSDGSGATAQFTIWMRQMQPAIWNAYCAKVGRRTVNGACGITSNFPTLPGSKFVARKGADGVSAYTAQAASVGAITFVEYSYALNANFPVVKLLNAAGYYNEPTASNVAVALLQARINQDKSSQNYLTQDLSGVYGDKDPRTYPLSSYSYIIMPTALEGGFTKDKGLTLSGFTSYFLCEGQRQAEVLGYSPLPVNLVLGGQNQIRKIPGRDPKFTEFTIAKCNNPTLDPSDPNGNALAKKAPFPPACDRKGTSQCTIGTGGAKDTQTAANGNGGAGGGGGGAGGPSGGSGGGAGGSGGGAGGPGGGGAGGGAAGAAPGSLPAEAAANADGEAVSVDAAPVIVNANPQTIPVSGAGVAPMLAVAGAGVGILAATLVPPLLGRRSRRSFLVQSPRGSRSNR